MREVSQREFARSIGVTHRAVQKAIAAGRITLTPSKKINPDTASIEWQRNTDESKKSFADLSRQAASPVSAAPPAADMVLELPVVDDELELDDNAQDEQRRLPAQPTGSADAYTMAYRAARAGRERTRHEREKLELDQLRGNLIELAEAQRLAFTALRTVRDAVMNVAVRVKDVLAAETDEALIQQRLEDELAVALGAIDSGAILREVEADETDGSD